MEIILKEDVEHLGFKYDLVTVKDGFARNFLIPTGVAELATESIKKQREEYLFDKQHNASARTKRLRDMPIDRRPPNWCKELYEKVKKENEG